MRLVAFTLTVLALSLHLKPSFAQSDDGSFSWSSSYSSTSSSSWGSGNASPQRSHTQENVNGRQRIVMQSLPLIGALEVVSKAGPAKIVVSERARKLLVQTDRTISLASRNEPQARMLHQILAGTGIRVVTTDKTLALLASSEELADAQVTPISRVALDEALGRRITLHLDHVPVHMAVQMIEGLSGLRLQYPSEDKHWPIHGPFVTVHADARPVQEVIRAVAKQAGREVRIRNDGVELAALDE